VTTSPRQEHATDCAWRAGKECDCFYEGGDHACAVNSADPCDGCRELDRLAAARIFPIVIGRCA
jgi:hypothetical protein